ncbi:unnamed protein product [Arctia plantaginis]|uniref:Reverse transcriptase domain-containing protein n=1 Tax=Arctia plantaginis TaxID=874455 RepID=A0A8S1AJT2_ARCPL|nr:unnamed protein product [Arctia plantaginis]
MERPSSDMTRKVLDIETKPQGRGRPRITWTSVVNRNLKEAHVNKEMTQDRAAWRHMIRRLTPNKMGKGQAKKEKN